MNYRFALFVSLLLSTTALAGPLDDLYRLGPDSLPQEGVPKGEMIGPLELTSEVYPGTTRNYWIYIPAQYDPRTPASVAVFQDGHAFVNPDGEYRIANVFDNLIFRREMPVTIGIFINAGHTPEQAKASDKPWGDQTSNRGLEYNALDDTYARLIIDELLPSVAQKYNLSRRPEDRLIGGSSSGAIAAFTVAWHRPDQFGKVVSFIGSYVDIRGGHVYPDLIRTSDRRPIRIYLQDGINDYRGKGRNPNPETPYNANRDWHAQNLKMLDALTEKDYDVNYCWGIGTHSAKHGGAIMPEIMRWMWRDYPRALDDPLNDTQRQPLVPAKGSI